jgi:adenosylcobinamide-phosphate synthase
LSEPGLDGAAAAWVPAVAVAFALWLDHRFGEPPLRLHPVVAMGKFLDLLGPRLVVLPPLLAFAGGMLAWALGGAITLALAYGAERLMNALPFWLAAPALGLLLKPLLAWRLLRDEVAGVETALGRSVEDGRTRLSRLVSRDTAALDAVAVRESAIESLAENLSDSLVAPLFWFALAGLPGAALYRFANTADAMWGYRGRYEWAGKWAARADDVLSWLPARITALLLVLVAGRRLDWGALRGDAGLTPSPNGGWPMGAMARLLGVRLAKPGVYALNAAGGTAAPAHTALALAWAGRAVLGAAGLAIAALAAMGQPLLWRMGT